MVHLEGLTYTIRKIPKQKYPCELCFFFNLYRVQMKYQNRLQTPASTTKMAPLSRILFHAPNPNGSVSLLSTKLSLRNSRSLLVTSTRTSLLKDKITLLTREQRHNLEEQVIGVASRYNQVPVPFTKDANLNLNQRYSLEDLVVA